MPARTNKRLIYAHQAVTITPDTSAINVTHDLAKGVQEVGISTNFNNTPYFELGQLAIYEDVEELPDVEVTITKALDGRPLLYHLATSTMTLSSPTLAGRQNAKCRVRVGIFPDTNDYSTGVPPAIVECSGLFPSSLQYTFPVDGTFTETLTLVGNDKLWKGDSKILNPADSARANSLSQTLSTQFLNDVPVFTGTVHFDDDADTYTFANTGVQRRQHLNFTPWSFYPPTGTKPVDVNGMVADPFCTVLPPDVDGISSSGTNNKSNGVDFDAHIQNITISVDLGREQLNELGRRAPYHRFVQLPVEVTCSIEVIATSGDLVSATEGGIRSPSQSACAIQTNLMNRTIRVATCHKEIFYLGTKNKLTSVEFGGGNTDGGNATVTYNYRNYNHLTVMAFSDPHDNDLSPRSASISEQFWNENIDRANQLPGWSWLVN